MIPTPSFLSASSRRYRAVYLDLDGTLLDPDREIPQKAKEILCELVDRKVRVGVATGRMYRSAAPYVRAIRSNAPLIIYNGARIVTPQDGRILWRTSLGAWAARLGLEAGRKAGVHINLYLGSDLYMEKEDPLGREFLFKENLTALYTDDLTELLSKDPVKILFIGPNHRLLELDTMLRAEIADQASLTFSERTYLEMLPLGVSKGNALALACQMLKMDPADAVTFGDAPNDSAMLRLAGLGIAMGNADANVKSAARYVTGPNHLGGVAEALSAIQFDPDLRLEDP